MLKPVKCATCGGQTPCTQCGVGRWIPTSERIPEPEVDVLCYAPRDILGPGHVVFVDWFGSKRDAGRGVTHWMPLPPPPTGDSAP